MADNKRFVSYMYEYKGDEKRASIGYTKVDARDNQCKIAVHISLPGAEGKLLKAYMFYRKPGKTRFAYLGSILIQNGTGELKVKSDRNNIANSELSVDDLCGVIVYQNSQVYTACEWDDKPITQELVRQIEDTDLTLPTIPEVESIKDTFEEVTAVKPKEENVESLKEEIRQIRPSMSAAAREQEPQERPEEAVLQQAPAFTEKGSAQEESREWYENRDYYKEQSGQENYNYRNLEYDNQMHSESLKGTDNVCPDVECIEPTYGTYGEGIEQESARQIKRDGAGKFECHPIAQNIFRRFPRIYPFEDNEICDCVRIEPQDIGLLPIDAWVLGNNSYLLHGYYTYRHLIFGKMKTANGILYVLGVPGIYQNRESFMAKMFGFEYFKCAKLTEEKNGEFGYYYLPIQLG